MVACLLKFLNFNSNDCKWPPSSESKNRYILGSIVMVKVIATKFKTLMYIDTEKPTQPGNL